VCNVFLPIKQTQRIRSKLGTRKKLFGATAECFYPLFSTLGVGIAVIGNLTRMLELPLPVKSVAFFSTSFFPPRGLKWGFLFAALPPNPKGEILGLILKYSSPHDMH